MTWWEWLIVGWFAWLGVAVIVGLLWGRFIRRSSRGLGEDGDR